jgi:hypothetical protein
MPRTNTSFSGGGGTGSCLSIDICPDLILAAIAVAAGGAVFLIYQAITVAGRRKKRDDHNKVGFFGAFFSLFLPKYLKLEDFLNIIIVPSHSVIDRLLFLLSYKVFPTRSLIES